MSSVTRLIGKSLLLAIVVAGSWYLAYGQHAFHIEALKEAHDSESIREIMTIRPDGAVHDLAVEALVELRDPFVVEYLSKKLEDGSVEAVQDALDLLIRATSAEVASTQVSEIIESKEITPVLIVLLREKQKYASVLSHFGPEAKEEFDYFLYRRLFALPERNEVNSVDRDGPVWLFKIQLYNVTDQTIHLDYVRTHCGFWNRSRRGSPGGRKINISIYRFGVKTYKGGIRGQVSPGQTCSINFEGTPGANAGASIKLK